MIPDYLLIAAYSLFSKLGFVRLVRIFFSPVALQLFRGCADYFRLSSGFITYNDSLYFYGDIEQSYGFRYHHAGIITWGSSNILFYAPFENLKALCEIKTHYTFVSLLVCQLVCQET